MSPQVTNRIHNRLSTLNANTAGSVCCYLLIFPSTETSPSSTERFKIKFDQRWAAVAMAAQRQHPPFESLALRKINFCLLCWETTALELWIDFITTVIKFQIESFNMHCYTENLTHITTYWIHLPPVCWETWRIGMENKREMRTCAMFSFDHRIISVRCHLVFEGWQFLYRHLSHWMDILNNCCPVVIKETAWL